MSIMHSSDTTRATALLACLLLLGGCAAKEAASARAAPPERQFASAEDAAAAFVAAAESFDLGALKAMLGSQGEELVDTEDSVADRNRAAAFASEAREQMRVEYDSTRTRATMVIGADDWPAPIPIVQQGGKWWFDAAAGHDEILRRRIGDNELDAIQVCRGYVEAQRAYGAVPHDGAALNQYAQRMISTPGKHDGLAWQDPDGTWRGPVGEVVARAIAEGYTDRAEPFHGYFFKVLKGQGPAAPLGEMDFVVKGAMIGGFALVAAPAEYLVTGVKTFIVSHDGIVYEKDLGEKTLEVFKAMERYNPDSTWTPVQPD